MPTWTEAIQFITALAALGSVGMSYINGRKLNIVHDLTNSKMNQLLEVTRESGHAAGEKLGLAAGESTGLAVGLKAGLEANPNVVTPLPEKK